MAKKAKKGKARGASGGANTDKLTGAEKRSYKQIKRAGGVK